MYKAKQIDGEWVVVDDNDEIVNSEVDGRISAITTASRMNREESEEDSGIHVHRGNSYGNTNDDDDDLNEDNNYYEQQFSRLKSGPNMEEYAIQIRDNEGNKTNWMTIYKPALNKIKNVVASLDNPDTQRMNDNGNSQEIREAFGKEGRISPFDAHQIVSNFDNKDFFELDFDQKDQLIALMKKYKYRQSKLSGSSGRSELRSFYYYLEKLAAKWKKSPNNKNNVSENSENKIDIKAEEIPKALMNGQKRLMTANGSKTEDGIRDLITTYDPANAASVIMNGKTGRIDTLWGDKTEIGLTAVIKRYQDYLKSKDKDTVNEEEIDEAIKLYTPDTNVEELDTNELKNYISFIQQKMKEIKDEEEKEKFNAALSRAEEELDNRENDVNESLNESLITTIYKTIKN